MTDSEITNINQKGEKIEIETEVEKTVFDLSKVLNLEVQLLDEDSDISTIMTSLGTVVGFVAGDFTGAIGGGFSGWLASKFFGKEKTYFITIILIDNQKFTFTSKQRYKNANLTEIQNIYNEFLTKKVKDNIKASQKWPNNLKNQIKQKKYIAFSDIFTNLDISVHEICDRQSENSNLLDPNNQKSINKYLLIFKSIDLERKKKNNLFIKKNLDNINLKGLIPSQKKAVLTDDDSTLINAGAGSGKTKTILHKLAYLIDNKMCKPEEVLVLAYNRNVMHELKERISSFSNKNIKRDLEIVAENSVKTFHGYGFRQIKGKKGADFIEKKSDFESEYRIKKGKELDKIIDKLYSNKKFQDNLLTYFAEYFFTYKDYFKDIETYDDYVKYIRNIGQITLSGIPMRSYEEVEIANYLFINGIKFEYEKEYDGEYLYESDKADFSIKNKNHLKKEDKKYHPDFYLTDYKIYLEHFALNKDNEAPSFFKNPQGYYDQYLEKIQVHKNNKTKLITTFSWEKSEGKLLKSLEKKLKKHRVKFKKIKYNELLKIFKSSGKLSRFTELVSTFLSHYKSNELTEKQVKNKISSINGDNNKRRCLIFLELFIQIFNEYEAGLKKDNSIDFDDMIIEGRKQLENENFKYVIVDEFQDISQGRAKFLKKIKELNSAKLYCVGDDWQAINKFSGGDVTIFTLDFKNTFGHFELVDIDTTFRYGNLINNISSEFVQKNPSQFKKKVSPFKDIKGSSINIYEKNIFSETMNKIIKKHKNIYILGRYNLDKYNNSLKKNFWRSNIITRYEVNKFIRNKSLDVSYKTIHAAKGLEADVVCVVNMFPGILGFPSQMENDEILSLVLPNPEEYPNAEERRLMYVAMTRAKKELHLFSGNGFYSSEFVKELKKEFPSVDDDKNMKKNNKFSKSKCPTHSLRLVRRNGYRGPFYGCPKFFSAENCRYTEDA
tara:strand:+ start:99 stop:2942 length:2844 start_codon:yes stop_codon:yes gene_type:complete